MKIPDQPLKIIMDKDVQIVHVNEPEREIDEFEDGVGKKKRKLEQTSLLKFTRYGCYVQNYYSGSTPMHFI